MSKSQSLRAADLRAVAEFVARIHTATADVSAAVLEAGAELLQMSFGQCGVFSENWALDSFTPAEHRVLRVPPEIIEASARIKPAPESLGTELFTRGRRAPVLLVFEQDIPKTHRFRRSEYVEIIRPLAAKDQFQFVAPLGGGRTLGLAMFTTDREIGPRERVVLEALMPHVRTAMGRTAIASGCGCADEPGVPPMVMFDRAGKAVFANAAARGFVGNPGSPDWQSLETLARELRMRLREGRLHELTELAVLLGGKGWRIDFSFEGEGDDPEHLLLVFRRPRTPLPQRAAGAEPLREPAELKLALAAERAGLTPTELEVARLMWRGLSEKQIALRLGRGRETVKSHVGNIYRKWRVSGRAEWMAAAAEGLAE